MVITDGASVPGRLDRPPLDSARAALAPSFGRRFVLFGDAEEEFDWSRPLSRDFISTSAIARLPEATRRFAEHGVVPTYLVDYPVVADRRSADVIAGMVAADACDIGAHLHPWVNPPFDEAMTGPNSFAGNLAPALERAKLGALTERIARVIGRRPTVYRAGRYGVGPHTATILAEAGYRMDVSVRALFDYRDQHGPDFSRHPVAAWWIAEGLLEVPLTAAFTGAFRHRTGLFRFERLRGALSAAQFLNRVALTPEGTPLREALVAIRRLLDDDTRLFSLSFHTPSVEIGHTPYVRDAQDLKKFWRWWDGVFDLFAQENVQPARAEEIWTAARA